MFLFYHLIPVFSTNIDFARSLNANENTAEDDNTKRVSVRGRAFRPGTPTVVIAVAAMILNIIAANRVLLGIEFQKWLLSLMLKIKNIAEKNNISKVNV